MYKLLGCSCLTLLMVSHSWARGPLEITVNELLKTSTSWDGVALPAYPQGTPEVTVLKISIPPNTQLPLHKHPVMNAGVLLSGELIVKTENQKTLYLKAGDSIAEVVNTWHFGRNDGDVPAEILVVYAGIKGQPITVKKED